MRKLLIIILLGTRLLNAQDCSLYEVGMFYLKYYEGFRAESYYCPANKLTVGWGQRVNTPRTISKQEANKWLADKVQKLYDEIENLYPHLSRDKKFAITLLTYNIGVKNIGKSLHEALMEDCEDITWILEKYCYYNKKASPVLLKRRRFEAEVYKGNFDYLCEQTEILRQKL